MNKYSTYGILLSVLIPHVGMTQITVERSDLGNLTATTLILANDTVNLGSISPGNPGPNQTWNLSMLANHYQDTMAFIPPAGTPCVADFPQATFAVSMSDGYAYGYDDNTRLEIQGFCGDGAPFVSGYISLKIVPPERPLIFPLTFGTSWQDQNRQVLILANPNPPPDSVRIVTTTQWNCQADGWGMVSTPVGTFNSLRLKRIRDQIDSIFVKMFGNWVFFQREETHQTEYSWIPKGGLWLASIVVDNNSGQVIQAQYVLNPSTSIKEGDDNVVAIFPNPVEGGFATLIRQADTPAILTIIDMKGSILKTEQLNSAIHSLDLRSLAAGMYLCLLVDKTSDKASLAKLVVLD
jgi:hypothetical protein